jgi:MinD-like ATPase involved in chromosome partitioning or flagellar assembly
VTPLSATPATRPNTGLEALLLDSTRSYEDLMTGRPGTPAEPVPAGSATAPDPASAAAAAPVSALSAGAAPAPSAGVAGQAPPPRAGQAAPVAETDFSWLVDGRTVAQQWTGSRTVLVAQTASGVAQAPVASALAAVFGRWGHPGVVVWDNNESGSVLRWRAEWADHGATVADLLANLPTVMAPDSPTGVAPYIHPQTEDRYGVLQAGDPAESVAHLSTPAVDVLQACLARFYELVLVDVGRDVGAVTWRAAAAKADLLVVAVSELAEVATAVRLLDTLRWDDPHSRSLARAAIVVVVQPSPDVNVDGVGRQLAGIVPDIVAIPYDPGLQSGRFRYTGLAEATQRACLRAAALVAGRLA